MDWSTVLAKLPDAVPALLGAFVGGCIALLAAAGGQYLSHRFTRRREAEKLRREKAETLIFLLYQTEHRLLIWRLALVRQAPHTTPALVNRPVDILLDLNQADALMELYFPALRSQLEAIENALIPYMEWLEAQWDQHDRDFQSWRTQFRLEEAAPLYNAYNEASKEAIDAVSRAVPHTRTFARTLARLHRHQ